METRSVPSGLDEQRWLAKERIWSLHRRVHAAAGGCALSGCIQLVLVVLEVVFGWSIYGINGNP